MDLFESEIDGKHVALLYSGEGQPVHLVIRLMIADHDVVDDLFPNPVVVSATLRDELGYGPACDFLRLHGIPKTSRLWDLNHSGPPADNV